MREIFDDRRQEPRFPTRGTASYALGERRLESAVHDLSLNGVKVGLPDGPAPTHGSRFTVELDIPGAARFTAEVAVVYADAGELGLEFHDMPPRDFTVLVALIEHYAALRRREGSAVA